MVVKRGGLGRNLSALLSHSPAILERDLLSLSNNAVSNVAITSLKPGKYQPRTAMQDESLDELASSIKKQGVLQPLLIRQLNNEHYEILAGERRWRAAQLAGLSEIPAILHQVDDETAMAIGLVENLQREDLNAMDQARAMHRLTDEFGLTHQQVAELLSKSRTAVSNYLRLLSLNPAVKRLLEHGDLDMGHARTLLILNEDQQYQVAELVVAKNLSVRETEKLVAKIKSNKMVLPKALEKIEVHAPLQAQVQQLALALKTKVNIKPGKSGKGTLVIHYDTMQNLEAVINQLVNSR